MVPGMVVVFLFLFSGHLVVIFLDQAKIGNGHHLLENKKHLQEWQ
jgi:hypothetical protein